MFLSSVMCHMTHTVFLFLPTVVLFREQLRCVGFFRQFTDGEIVRERERERMVKLERETECGGYGEQCPKILFGLLCTLG